MFFRKQSPISQDDVEVGTLYVTLKVIDPGEGDHLREAIAQNEDLIACNLRRSIATAIEPEYFIQALSVSAKANGLLIKIGTHRPRIGRYEPFEKLADLLLQQVRGEVLWFLRGEVNDLSIETGWYPSPQNVRSRRRSSFWVEALDALKHPLVLLLMGTLFGSLLIPRLNERSEHKKLRHEQRLKMALSIIEQSHETDRKMSSLTNYLDLFRGDEQINYHGKAALHADQYKARQRFDDMYLDFNAQAWFWHWNIRSESTLAALATPDESEKITMLANEYTNALIDETKAMSELWGRFLKTDFDPSDRQNSILVGKVRDEQSKARDRRNNAAIEMAKVLSAPD